MDTPKKTPTGLTIDFSDLASAGNSDGSSVFDASGTRGTQDSRDRSSRYPIDAFDVDLGEHIVKKDLEALYKVIKDKTRDKSPGSEAQVHLVASQEYAEEVKKLTPNEKKVIGAMAHKESDGTTRVSAFAFFTTIKEEPVTVTIKLKDGTTVSWNMPQHELLDHEGKTLEVQKFEEDHSIRLPRTEECFLNPGQQTSAREEDTIDLEPKTLAKKSHGSSGTQVDFGSRMR